MPADPNKMLVTLTPITRDELEQLAAQDAEIGRRADMSATVRRLIREETARRKKSRKDSRQTA